MEQKKHKWLAIYFKNWQNCLTFAVLLILVAAGFYLRFRNLGYLSFWGDDGHTVLGTLSIIKQGYPRLPSGFMLFHSILSYYLNVIFVLVFGSTEFAFRLPSVLMGCGSIIVIYFFGKEIANKFTGFLAASVITFSTWYIHFAREARYYQALQFFVLTSLFFFYKGFVKCQKPYRIVATVFFLASPLVHGNAFFLIIAFIALLFCTGRKFFKKHILIPFAAILAFYGFLIINQVFFWKVGRSFYAAEGGGFVEMLAAYFRRFDPYYFKILNIMFPEMVYIVLAGLAVLIGLSVFISVKKKASFADLYLNENKTALGKSGAGFACNLFMLYFFLFATLMIFSIGRMYNQQRYIYFVMPVFILLYAYTVYVLSFTAGRLINLAYKKLSKRDISKKVFAALLCIIFAAISFFTVSGIDLKQAHAIAEIKHSDSLDTMYAISTAMPFHWDAASTGKYVAENIKEGDIVITTDIYNSYPYTRAVDYWLWTGDLVSWKPYHLTEDGEFRDDTHGVPLIRDIFKFIEIFNQNHDKNIWVICSYSITIPEHVSSIFADFFEKRQQDLVLTARDNVAKLYYFSATKDKNRLSITDFMDLGDENILKISKEDAENGQLIRIDFTDPQNQGLLKAGWTMIEDNIGCWATGRFSALFFDFEEGIISPDKKSNISFTARPLPYPSMLQTVSIILNGIDAGIVELSVTEDFLRYSIEIGPGILKSGINTIAFKYRYSFSPAEIGLGPDSRNLSVLFREIEISIPGTNEKPFAGGAIPIVALHGIEPQQQGRYELSTSDFEQLCKVIVSYGYKTITFMDLLDYIEGKKMLPEKPVIITSDDGYQNIYTHAYPILKKYGLKMTVFLATGLIAAEEGQRRMNEFDFDVPEVPRRPMLIWPEVIEMAENGLEFQSHGVTHRRIGEIPLEDAYFEITRSKADIEENLLNTCLFISWPHNSYSDEVLAMLPGAGYSAAVTYKGGIENIKTMDIYAIKRIQVYSNTGAANYAEIMGLN